MRKRSRLLSPAILLTRPKIFPYLEPIFQFLPDCLHRRKLEYLREVGIALIGTIVVATQHVLEPLG